jgi:hypothetical protein
MHVTVAKLTKARLAAMPANERSLLLLLGHVLNEVNVLEKLILACSMTHPTNKIVDIVEAGQGLILVRILIGKLHEANLLVQKRVNSDTSLKAKHALTGQNDAAKALRSLNTTFAKSGQMIAAIRNTVAFHASDDDNLIEDAFLSLTDAEPWDFYLARARANAFYYASELCMTRVALGHTPAYKGDKANEAEGLRELIEATLEAARHFSDLGVLLMVSIIEKNCAGGIEDDEVDIGPASKMSEFKLPFFFDDDDFAAIRDKHRDHRQRVPLRKTPRPR